MQHHRTTPRLFDLIGRFLPRIPSRADREMAYLNGAVSLYDLESREREIARGKFAQF